MGQVSKVPDDGLKPAPDVVAAAKGAAAPGAMTEHERLLRGEHERLLQQVEALVRSSRRRHWVEVSLAVLLATATMQSAWCVYQATLWSGVQTFRLADANRLRQEALELTLRAGQIRLYDRTQVTFYLQSRAGGNKPMQELARARLDPHLRPAVDAWLRLDPLRDPAAPQSPLLMKEYVVAEEGRAAEARGRAAHRERGAEHANRQSDRYVLLTVLCTATLFFCGISGTFEMPRIRLSTFCFAGAVFAVTFVVMLGMPVCRE